jgi:SH3 domain protein
MMRWLIATMVLLPMLAAAETAYVTDNLRLGLHRAADTSDRAFRNLDSGQALEILSRNRNYAHVRLPDGVTGYVKAAYLVPDKPAKLIVAETQAERDGLQAELEEVRRQFEGPAETIAALERQTLEQQVEIESSQQRIMDLDEKNADLRDRQAQYKYSLPLGWVGGATGVCLVGGFMLGLWWADHRSRQRHGGIRIY